MSIGVSRAAAGSSAGEVVVAYLGEQLESLREHEPLVQVAAEDAVHQMRVACRRARSALDTGAPLFQPRAGDHLREELRWLGEVLGRARDAEVLRERMATSVAAVAPDPAGVGARVDTVLRSRHVTGLAGARAALDGPRYAELLAALERFVADPPYGDRAHRAAAAELARLVLRDWSRLRARLERAAGTPAGPGRDAALHDVRKAAKRLRYAAEAAAGVLGPHAVRLAEASEAVQEALGEHHDSVVARDLLRDLVAPAEEEPDGSAVFDRLHEREAACASAAERAFLEAWAELPRKHRARWLSGRGAVGGTPAGSLSAGRTG